MLNKNDEFHSLSEDIIFKYIFGCKKNIRFTTWLLESLFNLPQNSLKDNINIENSLTLNKTKFLEKGFELDIKISMPSGWIINLEMYQFGFRKKERIKSLMYIMHIMSTGLDIGHNYEMDKKHLQINFIIDKKYPSGTYLMLDKRNNKLLVDDLIQVDVINIDNYKDSRYDVDEYIKKLFLLMKARM